MSMPLTSYYSASDVRALPDDGKRYETVHGELLVTPAPAPRHQLVLQRLNRVIDRYLASHGIEDALMSPADISFGEDTLVQPDFFVADTTRARQTNAWSDIRTLYLAVEVLSPSTARADRFPKRRLYQEQRGSVLDRRDRRTPGRSLDPRRDISASRTRPTRLAASGHRIRLCRQAGGAFSEYRRQRRGAAYFATLSPTIPSTISAIDASRSGALDSPRRMMPSIAVPTAPMPTQTA